MARPTSKGAQTISPIAALVAIVVVVGAVVGFFIYGTTPHGKPPEPPRMPAGMAFPAPRPSGLGVPTAAQPGGR